jgi:hypothetical protein
MHFFFWGGYAIRAYNSYVSPEGASFKGTCSVRTVTKTMSTHKMKRRKINEFVVFCRFSLFFVVFITSNEIFRKTTKNDEKRRKTTNSLIFVNKFRRQFFAALVNLQMSVSVPRYINFLNFPEIMIFGGIEFHLHTSTYYSQPFKRQIEREFRIILSHLKYKLN